MTPDAIADVIVGTVQRSIAPLVARLATTDGALDALRERLVAVETRAPVPGPPGAPGVRGERGLPGADGLGFDDLSVDFDGDRTLSLRFARGDVTKSFPIALPMMRYQGTYQETVAYVVGDVVTSGGAAWHCQQPTTLRPGNDVSAWRLMVRKGRDGRDGKAT
jgi:hypothetical protein